MEHRITFNTGNRAGCICGHVAVKTPRENALRGIIRHITRPTAPGKIADAPYEHDGCTIEQWSVKWGVCQEHNVYIDLEARGVDPDQTMLPLTFTNS